MYEGKIDRLVTCD